MKVPPLARRGIDALENALHTVTYLAVVLGLVPTPKDNMTHWSCDTP